MTIGTSILIYAIGIILTWFLIGVSEYDSYEVSDIHSCLWTSALWPLLLAVLPIAGLSYLLQGLFKNIRSPHYWGVRAGQKFAKEWRAYKNI